jgi:hypothetical protein
MTPDEQAEQFIKISRQFRLGELSTEKPNPLSRNLSTMTQKDVKGALQALKSIDVKMLGVLSKRLDYIYRLKAAIDETRNEGGKNFYWRLWCNWTFSAFNRDDFTQRQK